MILDFSDQAASALANRRFCAPWGTVNLLNKSAFTENASFGIFVK